MEKLRTFNKIPIFIVEDHNDVLNFIYRCLGSRHLPFQGNTLVHFDAHPDLTVPMALPSDAILDRETLLSSLSIENWLIPLCFAGHVNRLVWVRQEWAKQIPTGRHDFVVGETTSGGIRVDSELEYFISEGSFVPTDTLRSRKNVVFEVGTAEDILSHSDEMKPKNFILDVDLDYFSTHNPFLNLHQGVNLYERLKDIYSYKLDRKNLPATVERRVDQLKYLEGIFSHLQKRGNLENFDGKNHPLFESVDNLHREILKDSSEVDWEIIHSAGCTLDSTELPHHESTEEELRVSLATFKDFLRKHPTPTIITISRSSEDDYCPSHQVESIQNSVLEIFKDIYADSLDEPQFFYKD